MGTERKKGSVSVSSVAGSLIERAKARAGSRESRIPEEAIPALREICEYNDTQPPAAEGRVRVAEVLEMLAKDYSFRISTKPFNRAIAVQLGRKSFARKS